MPNLIITNACDLGCPYCFASEYRALDTAVAERMSLDEFRALLDFSSADEARFCGGEPSLHPDFVAMLELSLSRPRGSAFVMTNGLWPDSVRHHVETLPARRARRITYLVNALPPALYTDRQRTRLEQTLRALPPGAVTLGATIHEVPVDLSFLLALAERFNFRNLRYSVAAPNVSDPRTWSLDPETDFPAVATGVYDLVSAARARGLSIHSDCGYVPPCMFTDAQLAELLAGEGDHPAPTFFCHGPVDIGPGGVAWRCFGLYSTQRVRTDDFLHAGALDDHFEHDSADLEGRELFDFCADCSLSTQSICGGGCHAYRAVRALRARARAEEIPIEDDRGLLEFVPEVDAKRLRRWVRADRTEIMIYDRGEWAPLLLTPLETRVLDACDGSRTVADIIVEVGRGSHKGEPAHGVCRAARRLYERAAVRLRRRSTTEP